MDRKKQNEEDMKRFILTLTVMLACIAMSVDAAPHHRNHLDAAVVADTAHTGIEAYSDTASWDAASAADSTYYASTPYMDDDLDDFGSFVDFCKPLFGMGGIAIAVIVCLLVLLFLAAPLIAVILIVRHLIKQRNDRIALAEKALEHGQPIPSQLCEQALDTNEALWRKGIRNVSIGVGMIVMFYIWSSSMLMGIGALVACYGVGQLVIVRTTGVATPKHRTTRRATTSNHIIIYR